MKVVTERSILDIKEAAGMTMAAALNLSGAELPEQDSASETVANLALNVWPDVTPRDLVALGMGLICACAVFDEGTNDSGGVEVFASMVNSLSATVDNIKDRHGVDLSGRIFCGPARAGLSEAGE